MRQFFSIIDIALLLFIIGTTIFIAYELINYWGGHSLNIEELILSFLIFLIGLNTKIAIELSKHSLQLEHHNKVIHAIGNDLKEHLIEKD